MHYRDSRPCLGQRRSSTFKRICLANRYLAKYNHTATVRVMGRVFMEYTRFEKARIIGARALQLAYGAPPLVSVPPNVSDPLALAEIEFAEDAIPIVVIRE